MEAHTIMVSVPLFFSRQDNVVSFMLDDLSPSPTSSKLTQVPIFTFKKKKEAKKKL